jgi:hypothetical protein
MIELQNEDIDIKFNFVDFLEKEKENCIFDFKVFDKKSNKQIRVDDNPDDNFYFSYLDLPIMIKVILDFLNGTNKTDLNGDFESENEVLGFKLDRFNNDLFIDIDVFGCIYLGEKYSCKFSSEELQNFLASLIEQENKLLKLGLKDYKDFFKEYDY